MNALVIGSTGAVGTELVKELIQLSSIKKITLLSRRHHKNPIIEKSPKVTQHIVDVMQPQTYSYLLQGHELAFSTLGVGEPSKVSKDEYYKVDYESVVNFATECRKYDVKHFSALVAVGADSKSGIYYLKVKGQLEDTLSQLGFERVSFFEPSMIMTPENRYGITQAIALKVFPFVDHLLVGSFQKYRSIKVELLGQSMAQNALIASKVPTEHLTWKDFKHF